MKVVLLAPKPPPAGGIASWTVKMLNTTLKNGWEVKVVDEQLIGKRENFGNSKRNLLVEIKRCLIIWRQLWNSLRDNDVKVVHSCIPASTTGMLREYICAVLTKFRGRKFLIHYHCTVPNMVTGRIGLFVFRRLMNISDGAIVLNVPSEQFTKKYSKTPVVVVPNFIEQSAVKNGNTRVINKEVNRVLYVGGVVESKGCYDIIDVARNFPHIEFRLVGNPEKGIWEKDKPVNVILCGEKSRGEVDQELEEADLFMFVTHFPGEGFSIALLEAMAKGIPCIVTDWAANRDMIEEHGGVVVKIKDIGAMVSSLRMLEKDQDLRRQQSEWNLKRVRECYIEGVVTDMYVDAYESLLR